MKRIKINGKKYVAKKLHMIMLNTHVRWYQHKSAYAFRKGIMCWVDRSGKKEVKVVGSSCECVLSVYDDGTDSEVYLSERNQDILDWQTLFFLAFDDEMALMIIAERSMIKSVGIEVQMANSKEYVEAIMRQAYSISPFVFGSCERLLDLEESMKNETDPICFISGGSYE